MATQFTNQNSSVAVRLKAEKANKDGLCPIVIRVTVDRQSAFYSTSNRVHPDQWDETTHQIKPSVPNAKLINASLSNLKKGAEEFILLSGLNGQLVSAKQVINSLGSDGGRDDLLAYWRKMLADLKGIQHEKTLHQFKSDYNKLIAFRPNVTFGQVTPSFLREFDQYMAVTLKNEVNTRWKTFKNLKKLFNLAKKDKLTTLYPFDDYDCPKYQQNLRTYLTMGEVDRIEALISNGMLTRPLWIAANYFLLSCYAGFRYQDLQNFDPMIHQQGDRLVLATAKTGEVVSIQRHKRLNVVLARLQSKPGLISNQKVNEYLKTIGGLADIDKALTVHVGRHTFAVNCAEMGIPSDVVMKLLGHTNIKTTHIYYKITNSAVDTEMSKWDNA